MLVAKRAAMRRTTRRRLHLAGYARNRQTGLAVAVILVGLATAALTALLTFASPAGSSLYSDRQTDEALAQARWALIGRAATDDNRPGSLPCPDTNDDGIAELLSGNVCPSNVGRLPWRTLGLAPLRDASGELLWYALSPSLTDDDSYEPINSNTLGNINVIGSVPATDVAAVVIAPGASLSGQDRNANPNAPAHYLEGENADGNNTYQTATASPTFNDRIAVVTRAQLFDVVEWRVANEMRATLRTYYDNNGFYPYANDPAGSDFTCTEGRLAGRVPNPDTASISCPDHPNWNNGLGRLPPAWFFANDWHLITYYALAPGCTKDNPTCGGSVFLQVNGVGNMHAVIIVGSRPLSPQNPSCVGSLCIEQPSAASNQYQRQGISTSFNDKVAVVR